MSWLRLRHQNLSPRRNRRGEQMGTTPFMLYVAAMIVLLLGAIIDPPKFNVTRCIAPALALIIAAQLR